MAKNEAEMINSEIEKKIDESVMLELKEYEKEKNKEYEKKLEKLEHQFNSQVFEENRKAKKIIIKKQNEFEDSVRNEFFKIANSFVESDKYFDYLINNIEQAIENLNTKDSSSIEVYVTNRDKQRFEKNIYERFKCNVLEIPNSYIGGSICKDAKKNVLVNNTIFDGIN